ncbi:HlyC/CorC family transporter [Aggregicoccus sp. 17bor-14]|uniref:hemolysin family protein n=1 Tax=Myxococcaceae TaxID=31 RepID=UPI0012EFF1DA|nr:HlyC/CorC family transporter [Simulacricoccus sp. 17bor-14]MRI91845.1 HlyC/CorC family transporter [Aggregicoccus sp. 17bor-14]
MLVLLNGVFSGAEIAIISVRSTRLNELVEGGSRAARAVRALRANPDRFLATVQIGITVVGATAAAFGGSSIAVRLAPLLQGLGLSDALAHQVAFAAVVGLVSYLSLVLGELVPKSLALRAGERYALVIGPVLRLLSRLMRPFVWLLTASSNLVLRLFGDRTSFSESRLSVEELQQLMEEAAKSGSLHPRTSDIASRAFELANLSIEDIMVPRTRVVALPRDASAEDVKRVLLEGGHSRIPVYEGSIDKIVGYLLVKDLLGLALEQGLIVVEDALRPAYFVPETVRPLDVLQQMQSRRIQMAIVVDERGVLAGIVTIEDLVEELVGEIFNEHDTPVQTVRREQSGSLVVDGTTPIRELNRDLSLELPEGDSWTTVGGLCIALSGMIPPAGVKLTAEDGTRLEILEASPRRVKRVRLHPAPPKPVEAQAAID